MGHRKTDGLVLVLSSFVIVGFATLVIAQLPDVPDNKAFVAPEPTKECRLVVCGEDPRRTLVYLGEELQAVRELEISIHDFEKLPVAKCLIYEGVFAPTKPKVAYWSVASVSVVDSDAFQKQIDLAFEARFGNAESVAENPGETTTPPTDEVVPLVPGGEPLTPEGSVTPRTVPAGPPVAPGRR